jgi:hypothetical protein
MLAVGFPAHVLAPKIKDRLLRSSHERNEG